VFSFHIQYSANAPWRDKVLRSPCRLETGSFSTHSLSTTKSRLRMNGRFCAGSRPGSTGMSICWVITRRAPFTVRRKQRLSCLKRSSRAIEFGNNDKVQRSILLDSADEFAFLRRDDPANDSIFSPFQLSDVCNTPHQFFLRHNRAARKSKLKMQSAPVRRKSGGY
jgi:hypothetical protein